MLYYSYSEVIVFDIQFTPEAIEDLRTLRKRDQQLIIDEIEDQLKHEPTQGTRNRKCLRPNQLAEWELRVREFRVFYDVNRTQEVIKVVAIGHKQGFRLLIQGKEYKI